MAQGKVVVPYNKTPKSYIIKDKEGNVYRRNRRHIFIDKSNKKIVSNNCENEGKQTNNRKRCIKPPKRLNL